MHPKNKTKKNKNYNALVQLKQAFKFEAFNNKQHKYMCFKIQGGKIKN